MSAVIGNDVGQVRNWCEIANHGISLARAEEMVIARFMIDDRFDCGEIRYRAWGHIDGVAYCLAFTVRGGKVRPISLRRAHAKEIKRHVPQDEI